MEPDNEGTSNTFKTTRFSLVPHLSEVFELTPTNWNGPGFVFCISTEIVVQIREPCEKVFSY